MTAMDLDTAIPNLPTDYMLIILILPPSCIPGIHDSDTFALFYLTHY